MTRVVIGAGIAGSSVAAAVSEQGEGALLISDPMVPPDSLAGAVVLRRAWHKGDERDLFDRSMELYRQRRVPYVQGGLVTSYRRPGEPGRADLDWALMHPAAPLIRAHVERRISLGQAMQEYASRPFWCPGVYTRSVYGITWGVTWTHPDRAVLAQSEALTVHHLAPYKTIVAGWVGGEVRLGSSSAPSLPKAAQQGETILAAMKSAGLITSLLGWTPLIGRRCTANGGDLGGLHRTGYALAPAMAERLVHSTHPTSEVISGA